jgi:hypothetical protein
VSPLTLTRQPGKPPRHHPRPGTPPPALAGNSATSAYSAQNISLRVSESTGLRVSPTVQGGYSCGCAKTQVTLRDGIPSAVVGWFEQLQIADTLDGPLKC